MVFSSVFFLIYFLPAFLAIYFITPAKFKNAILLISSIAFYMWGAPKFIFAILATTTVDFYFVALLDRSKTESRRKLFLVLSLMLNVGMLFYFKYCNFFIENFNHILNVAGVKEVHWVKIFLPIGISFYTFESLTYVIDVYRKVHKPLRNFFQYQLYIILFPKLIAGPIIRYHEISDQIPDRSARDTIDNKLTGFYRFILGLSKKVIIANTMAALADKVFTSDLYHLNTPMAWMGMLAYAFQIYFDFSGYSDMAIGIGKMLGFKFPENFDNPYTSGSITEFWRRWHMTLGSWMKNYLYIPLGGNKVSARRLYINLWVVFVISGFWHGASWTFIFWGVYHGVLLVLERLFLLRLYRKLPKFIPVIVTFLLVCIGWVFFRADHFKDAYHILRSLTSFNFEINYIFINNFTVFVMVLAAILSFFTLTKIGKGIQDRIYYFNEKGLHYLPATIGSICLFYFCLAAISAGTFNPFIYFRF